MNRLYTSMGDGTFTIILASSACLLYCNTIAGGYVWDDRAAIVGNADVHGTTTFLEMLQHDFWGQDITLVDSHKSYRPVTTLSFRINHYLNGLDAWGYHLGNVIIYSLTVIAMYWLSLRWLSTPAARIASLLFCFHPIHVEAVASLVGRADCLCGFFYLLTIHFYTVPIQCKVKSSRKRHVYTFCAYVFSILACFAKEIGATVFGMLCVVDMCGALSDPISKSTQLKRKKKLKSDVDSILDRSQHNRQYESMYQKMIKACQDFGTGLQDYVSAFLRVFGTLESFLRICINITLLGLVLYFRVKINGNVSTIYEWSMLENHIHLLSSYKDRVLSYAQTHFWYMLKLIFPKHLCFDYGYACIPTIHSLYDVRNIFSVLVYLIVVILLGHCIRTCRTSLLLATCMMIIPFIPAANIFFPVGTVLAERLLFIPSIGYCMLVGDVLCNEMYVFWKAITGRFVRDEEANYPNVSTPPSKKSQTSPLRPSSSPSSPSPATSIDSTNVDYSLPSTRKNISGVNMGLMPILVLYAFRVITRNQEWNHEQSVYESALRVCPQSVKALNNVAMFKLGENVTESITLAEKAISILKAQPAAWVNLGIGYSRQGEYLKSIISFHEAHKLRAASAKTYGYTAVALFEWSKSFNSQPFIKKELQKQSKLHFDAATLGKFVPPSLLQSRASLAFEMEDFESAANFLESALVTTQRIKSLSSSIPRQDMILETHVCNQLGIIYERLENDEKAEMAFRSGLSYDPTFCELLSNLGNLYRRQGKLKEARECFGSCNLTANQMSQEYIAIYYNNFGMVEKEADNLELAAQYFEKAIQTLPNPAHPAHEIMANNHREVKRALLKR